MKSLLFLTGVWAVASAGAVDFASFVDVSIGTESNGHTTVAASYPFGMVQAGPDTGRGTWDYCSGYRDSDRVIWGFSQTHLSGTGCPDLGDLRLLPGGEDRSYPFRKETERTSPGHYAVTLDGIDVRAEVAVTHHGALYRFTYLGDAAPELLVDTQWMMVDRRAASRCVLDADFAADEATRSLEGWRVTKGWAKRKLHFRLETDRPWTIRKLPAADPAERGARHVLTFAGMRRGDSVMVRLALSANSVEAARRNLAAEIPGWDLATVRSAATGAWNRLLGTMSAEGGRDQLVAFYTSLYHLFVQPNDLADAGAKPYYSTLSTWDTFRAAHPLYTLLVPERVPGFVDSILADGEKHGFVSIWTLWGYDTQCMIGTHSIPVVVDAILKGLWKGDERAALRLLVESVSGEQKGRCKGRFDLLEKHGYYPFDVIRGESVSRTMECAYDDWCIARLAERLGDGETASRFAARADNWRKVFDPSIGLVRGRDTAGRWREPFDPLALGHGADTANDFTEGNSLQYTWHVMQDPVGLISAMGGRERFLSRLDSLFTQPSVVRGEGFVADVSGLIGQYAHGNEPSHHVAYFYQFAGRARRTAEVVREVFDKFYLPRPDGLCGNDDCGQMSAWYLFSAMGFYPFNPCGGEYVIGAPQLPKVTVELANGVTFTVEARNLSKTNKYVKSVMLNGRPLEGFVLRHEQLAKGGTLVFEMTD